MGVRPASAREVRRGERAQPLARAGHPARDGHRDRDADLERREDDLPDLARARRAGRRRARLDRLHRRVRVPRPATRPLRCLAGERQRRRHPAPQDRRPAFVPRDGVPRLRHPQVPGARALGRQQPQVVRARVHAGDGGVRPGHLLRCPLLAEGRRCRRRPGVPGVPPD